VNVTIPNLSLVVLIGPSGSGKTTFARRHFRPTEVLSSDACRGLVADDENDQSATSEAFEVLHFIAARRLAAGRLTVIDATNVKPEDRRPLVRLAREYHAIPVAVVFNLPEAVCRQRNAARPERDFGPHVIRSQRLALRRGLKGLQREGFRYVFKFASQDEVEAATPQRVPLWTDRREDHGPFDIIGDVHGCFDELADLLGSLGYRFEPGGAEASGGAASGGAVVVPPTGRKAVFLGDLVDRGPNVPGVLRLVMDMVARGTALCVPGNHDVKLLRKLRGRDVRLTHGLAESLQQLENEPAGFREQVAGFIDGLVGHYVLDGGHLVVAHAGMKAELQGRASRTVREFALYGETTGETDEFGLPVRCNWAADYRGRALVVYGHTPVPEAEWLNGTINIDTGCVFGGRLTALRYPEKDLVSVPARRAYATPSRATVASAAPGAGPEGAEQGSAPHGGTSSAALSLQQKADDLLDIEDLLGKRIISTRLRSNVIISEERGAAALEVLSRFAVDPRWLIYLPPTMSPCETPPDGERLEHPREAFAHYRTEGYPRVVCQEKHMGSRAVAIVCRKQDAVRRVFGVECESIGIIYTRTGRRFFDETGHESALLERLRAALEHCGLWDELHTDWVCLDCELLPWSAKAQALLREQYAATGAAGRAALAEVVGELQRAAGAGLAVSDLLEHYHRRRLDVGHYVEAYRGYCWPVEAVTDLKLAPFHLLASAGGVHANRDHLWHMDTLRRLCEADPDVLLATAQHTVDLADADSEQAGTAWWEELTGAGGEGMVVKPLEFVARGRRGLLQPAVKCRGREYLRIIYGPEYTRPEQLQRLRARRLNAKRALAMREFALGLEALERFVRGEPLRRVHECVFGVLALESEPVDPRL
jgi:protein phosphatase